MASAESYRSGDAVLDGLRVLVTRPTEQAQSLIEALSKVGAIPLLYPTISVEPPPSWELFDAASARLQSGPSSPFDWVVFTSPSAVRFALDRSPGLARALAAGRARTAAVGSETALKLQERGIAAALVPDDQRQEGLIESFRDRARGTRILFPQAIGGRELLRETLEGLGAQVEMVPVSQTRPLLLERGPPAFDLAIFASPSALRAFVTGQSAAALLGKAVAAIGATTAAAARQAGISVNIVPDSPSVAQLVQAICAWRSRNHPADSAPDSQ
jgi:uroporphyrinogen III methyltransferase/synthase